MEIFIGYTLRLIHNYNPKKLYRKSKRTLKSLRIVAHQ
jgi:hypothetical protein